MSGGIPRYTLIPPGRGVEPPAPDRYEATGLYARRSHEADPKEPSLEGQITSLCEWAVTARLRAPDGAVIALRIVEEAVETEVGYSETTRRPGIRRLIDLGERGVIRHLLVVTQDRLGRGRALGALTLECDEVGIAPFSITDAFDWGIGEWPEGPRAATVRSSRRKVGFPPPLPVEVRQRMLNEFYRDIIAKADASLAAERQAAEEVG